MSFKDVVAVFFRGLQRSVLWAGAVGLGLTIASAPTGAQLADANARVFGRGQPATIDELPPGRLLSDLNALPEPARARALRRLQGFSFPGNDVAHLRADPQGGVFYVDPAIDGAGAGGNGGSVPALGEITAANVFQLHSKPGASRIVYLDLDGHVVRGTAWNSSTGVDPLYMRPYDRDGDETGFNSEEVAQMAEVWRRVAEDYAPFDIDVTTEQPPAFGPDVGHILVSPRADRYGRLIYPDPAGGVAYVNVWGEDNFTYYQPALVFPEGLAYGAHNISEAASHELGHNLSLSHDGTSSVAYYEGHGTGYTDWAPIMGVGYYAMITQWSKGEYADANNPEEDLELIRGKLTYRGDDHEDVDFARATPLVRTGATAIVASTPVNDPDNLNRNNKGIVEDRSDVDLFSIDVVAGPIDLWVAPGWIDVFSSDPRRGMNLDVRARLYDELGNLLAQSDPADDTDATITASVAAGRYVLAIDGVGVGTPAGGYTDYGSLGQYFINGSVPDAIVHSAPPTAPNDLAAVPNGNNGILLTWTDPASTPDTNEAGYRLSRQANGGIFAEIASLPRDSTSHADNNLTDGSYVYRLEAYNGAGSNWSNVTSPVEVRLPVVANATGEVTYYGSIAAGSYLDTAGDAGFERLIEAHQGGRPNNRVSRLDHVWTVGGVQPGATVTLQVDAEAPANAEGDDFAFSYAVNDGPYASFALLENGTGRQTLSAALPPATSGNVRVRVVDTDQTAGNGSEDGLDIHRIRIVSAGNPAEQAPSVSIAAPADGHTVQAGEPVILSATAADYEDGDLSATVTWTSNRDGTLGSGANLTVSTLSIGSHGITASVTDSAHHVGEDSVSVNVTDPNAATTLQVASLTGQAVLDKGGKWTASVTTTVLDNRGGPMPGATVTGSWSAGATGSASCTTDGNGRCSVSKGGLRLNVPSVTFTITNVAHPSLAYGGGGATTVTVPAP